MAGWQVNSIGDTISCLSILYLSWKIYVLKRRTHTDAALSVSSLKWHRPTCWCLALFWKQEGVWPLFKSQVKQVDLEEQCEYTKSKCLKMKTEMNNSTPQSSSALKCFYLFSAHVNEQLSTIWTEGDIGGHQDSQAVIVVWEFNWQVTCNIPRKSGFYSQTSSTVSNLQWKCAHLMILIPDKNSPAT